MATGVAEKLISCSLCRGMESKEPIKYLQVQETNKKSVAVATLFARFAKKLIRSSLCRGMESKEPIKYLYIQETEKSVAMATLVARCCRKTNQLKSMQGFGMQRYPRKIFKPKKHLKSVALLPGVAQKTNQLRSVQWYGKQRTHKNIYKSKKRKKVLPWQHLLPGVPKN